MVAWCSVKEKDVKRTNQHCHDVVGPDPLCASALGPPRWFSGHRKFKIRCTCQAEENDHEQTAYIQYDSMCEIEKEQTSKTSTGSLVRTAGGTHCNRGWGRSVSELALPSRFRLHLRETGFVVVLRLAILRYTRFESVVCRRTCTCEL